MPAVIFTVVIGTIIGLALRFGNLINKELDLWKGSLSKIAPNKQTGWLTMSLCTALDSYRPFVQWVQEFTVALVWDDRQFLHLDF